MDKFIENAVCGDIDKIILFINKDNTHEHLSNIFVQIIALMMTNKVQENIFVDIVDSLMKRIARHSLTSELLMVTSAIKMLKRRDKILAYKFLIIMCVKYELDNKIDKICAIFKKTKLLELEDDIHNYITYMNAFNKFSPKTEISIQQTRLQEQEYICYSDNDDSPQEIAQRYCVDLNFDFMNDSTEIIVNIKVLVDNQNLTTITKDRDYTSLLPSSNDIQTRLMNIYNRMQEETHTEIINRLILLVKKFGVFVIRDAGIDVIHYDYVVTMRYPELVKYYNGSVNKLKLYFKKVNNTMCMHNDINNIYNIFVTTKNELCDISKYDFTSKSKDNL